MVAFRSGKSRWQEPMPYRYAPRDRGQPRRTAGLFQNSNRFWPRKTRAIRKVGQHASSARSRRRAQNDGSRRAALGSGAPARIAGGGDCTTYSRRPRFHPAGRRFAREDDRPFRANHLAGRTKGSGVDSQFFELTPGPFVQSVVVPRPRDRRGRSAGQPVRRVQQIGAGEPAVVGLIASRR